MVHLIFIPPMHSHVTDVLVYNLHMTIFSRVYSYVTRVYSYVTRVYSYVTRMLLVCSFSHNRWKFNASLLNDSEFMLMINQKVPDWREEFSDVSDKRVLWDLVKYRIRQVTIKYSKEKARVRRDKLLQMLKVY